MDCKVLYIQYTNPAAYPPLEHSSRILAQDGWQVLFLGTGALGAEALRFPSHGNITVQQMPFCAAGWRQKLHYLRFCFWVLGWTLRWQPQWVYASDYLSCPVAVLLSFLPGVRVIYHEHDSPAMARNSSFMRLCLSARRWLAQRAKMCIIPNQQRAERFAKEINNDQNVLCVWNCPALEEVSPPRPPRNSEHLWVLYHGSIVPPQLPPTVLNALAMLPEAVKLRVIGYETLGHRGYVQQLQEMACQLGIDRRVEFIGTVPTRNELLEWCRRCDVGIALFPEKSHQPMAGASNKAFDYLACGLALLISDLPDWKQMYVEPGYGLACNPDDPKSIAAALCWLLEHPDEMAQMAEGGRQRITAAWNYERQFAPILERMKENLS